MITEKDIQLYKSFQKSPLLFIKTVWGLEPELDNSKFVKGKHLTNQQYQILLAIEKALRNEASRKISVASGHGIGKSCVFSWIILWFLFCYKDAKISCTAPTSQQMYDVLWSEVRKWMNYMPKWMQELYEWTASYVRIKERPETWFARAATARKEAPEAFAGIHGEFVLLAGDEASGIADEIFESGRGALTDKNAFVFLFGNPLRLTGYFYETHHSQKAEWQIFNFSSLDSPLVDKDSGLVKEIREKYKEDSDEWRTRILGQFPKADAVDESGYVPLFLENDIKITEDIDFVGIPELGLDPSGEGDDDTVWAGRDRFRMKILEVEQLSNDKSMARRSLNWLHRYGSKAYNLAIDNFGVGANVAMEIALSNDPDIGDRECNALNVGEQAEDSDRFLNKRAEFYFRMKEWFSRGGEICRNSWAGQLKKELLTIRYRRERNGKLKIKSKDEMRKEGIVSPNMADAASLTFSKHPVVEQQGSSVVQITPNWSKSSRF